MSAKDELKSLLQDLNKEQLGEIKEMNDEQTAKFEERFGKVEERMDVLEKEGVPTLKHPKEVNVAIAGDPNGATSKIHVGYDLDVQGSNLLDMVEREPKLKQRSKIADPAFRDKYARFLIDVIKAGQGDPDCARRLKDAKEQANQMVSKAELAEGAGNTGGYLVPDEYTNEILAFARQNSLALSQCRIWPMSSDVRKIPAEDGAVSVEWDAEGEAVPESEPTLAEVTLTATRCNALAITSNELLDDSAVDIVSWLTELFAEAIGQELDKQVFQGTGTPCSGLTTAIAGYSVNIAAANYSTITGTDLSEMIAKLSANKRAGAKFFFEKAPMHYIRTLKDTTNNFIYSSVGGPQSSTIWGYPVDESEQVPNTNTTGQPFGVFGNLRYFALGRRMQNMTLDVDPYGLFTTYKTRFRIVNRWGMSVGLPNAFVRILTG